MWSSRSRLIQSSPARVTRVGWHYVFRESRQSGETRTSIPSTPSNTLGTSQDKPGIRQTTSRHLISALGVTLWCWGSWRPHDDCLHVATPKALDIGEDSQ